MPAVSAPTKVLVTGANGFIAAWVVRSLLDHGYSVRGTVRAESKSKYLRNLLKDDIEKRNLEFIVVPDITIPGAFNEAVKGVDAVVHAASPVHLKTDNPDEIIKPAVRGTLGVLESALKYAGPQLKRVIYMSSSGAVINTPLVGTFDETSWNEGSISEVREKGREANQMAKYRASKTLAEKAAWEFVIRHRTLLSWDLVTTCPTYVFGPTLSDARSPSELGESMYMYYAGVFSRSKPLEERAHYQSQWADVRDVSEAHVRVLKSPAAGGERFLLTKEPFNWLDWCDTTNELNIPGICVPLGTSSYAGKLQYKLRFDSTKARAVLGVKFRYSKRETALDIVDDFKARGFLN